MAKIIINPTDGKLQYTGDVVGAVLSTDNAISRFNGVTGKKIQNSGVIIDDLDNVSGVNSLIIDGTSTEALLVRQNNDAGDVFAINTTTPQSVFSATGTLQYTIVLAGTTVTPNIISSSNAANRWYQLSFSDTAVSAPIWTSLRARGTQTSPTIVQNGDRIAGILHACFDGVDYANSTGILFEVDGTPGSNIMPGRIKFLTAAEGSSGVTERFKIDNIGNVTFTRGANTVNFTASTENVTANFVFSAIKTFAAGAITTQREVLFQAPTYAFASASTITTAATLAISDAPTAGTNATITTSLALYSQAGRNALIGDTYIGTTTTSAGAKLIVKGSGSDIFSCDDSTGARQYTLADNGLVTVANGFRINGATLYSGSSSNATMYCLTAGTSWVIFANATDRKGLVVAGPSSGTMANNHFEVRQRWNSTGNEYLVVDSNGYTGIAKTSPTSILDISGYAASSGTVKTFSLNPAAHTGQTASTEVINAAFNTYTRTWATGAITTQRENVFFAPTYAFAGASTISNAATVAITAAPIAGTNATLTRSMALWVQAGYTALVGGVTIGATTAPGFGNRLRVDQTDGAGAAAVFEFSNGTHTMYWFIEGASTGGRGQIRTDSTRPIVLQDNATSGLGPVNIGTANASGYKLYLASGAASSGTQGAFKIGNPSHTGQTASTEINNIYFETYTRTWAAGAITTQREVLVAAPTYAFASASTITTAATVAISAAPIAGTNATITNAYSLWVQAGTSRFDGLLDLSGISAGSPSMKITATSDTPATTWTAGVPSNNPSGYIEITEGGTSKYIPFWT